MSWTKTDITSAIRAKVHSTRPSMWHIGITHDAAERRRCLAEIEKENVYFWWHWEAESLRDARSVVARFVKRGMKEENGEALSESRRVYVHVF